METQTTTPSRLWRKLDSGVIEFTLPPTDGTTGPEWIDRLEGKGTQVGETYAKSVLRSADFRPTSGVATKINVLPGSLFKDSHRLTRVIRFDAGRRLLVIPNAEVACQIRELFSDEEIKAMGLMWIITMHDPINVSGRDPRLLSTVGRPGLDVCCSEPLIGWHRGSGFAFAVSPDPT